MFRILDRIRGKSVRERRAIAVGIAGLITGVIFAMWFFAFVVSFGNNPSPVVSGDSFEFGSFFQSFQSATDILGAQVGGVGEQLKVLNEGLKPSDTLSNTDSDTDVHNDVSIPKEEYVPETAPQEVPSVPKKSSNEVTPQGIEIIEVNDPL